MCVERIKRVLGMYKVWVYVLWCGSACKVARDIHV